MPGLGGLLRGVPGLGGAWWRPPGRPLLRTLRILLECILVSLCTYRIIQECIRIECVPIDPDVSTGRISAQKERWDLYSGGVCPEGGLPPEGVSVQGVSVQGVSVQGVSVQGGIYPWGALCPGGSLSRESLSKGISVQRSLGPWGSLSMWVSVQRGSPSRGGLCPDRFPKFFFISSFNE